MRSTGDTAQDNTPPHDGSWWATSRPVERKCPNCEQMTHDKPCVMHYIPALDHGSEQRRQHPTWPIDGWLCWEQCPECGFNRTEQTVTDATVRAWGKEYGGWEPL